MRRATPPALRPSRRPAALAPGLLALALAACRSTPGDAEASPSDPAEGAGLVDETTGVRDGAAPEGAALGLADVSSGVQDAAAGAGAGLDPAALRLALLERMDASIDRAAAKAHVDARLLLDQMLPIPYLGLDADPAEGGGMRVVHVYPATAAERAGLLVGDLLRSLSGAPTGSKKELGAAIRGHAVGEPIELAVVRDGKQLTLRAELGKRPEEDEDEAEQFPDLQSPPSWSTAEVALDFEGTALDTTPDVLTQVLGGHGDPPSYVVLTDTGGDRFLRQISTDPTGIRFPMALVQGFRAPDVEARVRFRFEAGNVDRAAGVMLRYQDPYGYYVARVNAAENDLRIFRVAGGVRNTLPNGRVEAPCDDHAWHELVFRVEGSELTATLDGKYTAKACDSWFLAGGAGLWTKSDSVSDFDDLRLTPLGR